MMQRLGNVSEREMFRTFNMRIGMIVICAECDTQEFKASICGVREIGRVTSGAQSVDVV